MLAGFKLRVLFYLLNGAGIAGLTAWLVSVWSTIPNRIPVHFGLSGVPDSWGDKSELLALSLVGLGINVLILGLSALVPRLRGKWVVSLPGKGDVLALPKERQTPYWNIAKEFMALMALMITVIWAIIIVSSIQVADGTVDRIQPVLLWGGIAGLIVIVIFYMIRLGRLANRLNSNLDM